MKVRLPFVTTTASTLIEHLLQHKFLYSWSIVLAPKMTSVCALAAMANTSAEQTVSTLKVHGKCTASPRFFFDRGLATITNHNHGHACCRASCHMLAAPAQSTCTWHTEAPTLATGQVQMLRPFSKWLESGHTHNSELHAPSINRCQNAPDEAGAATAPDLGHVRIV